MGRTQGPQAGPLTGLPQFTDVTPVAAGATGQVFRARQAAVDRLVAVKVLGLAVHDPRVRARFERELATTGRLSAHPFLVTVLDHGVTAAGYPYLVMPWYDRGSLADELARRGRLGVPEALAAGVRVGAGLAHAHRLDVLHRDVKPANVLVSGHGEAVLADFGDAVGDRGDGPVTAAYTPAHAAPELLRGEPAGQASDVWSLASTLWTVLAGHRPFAAGPGLTGPAGELARAVGDPVPPLPRPDLPPGLEALLVAGLAKRPEDRPPALGFAVALQQVQAAAGLPVTEIPGSAPPPPVAPSLVAAVAAAGPEDPLTVRRPVPPAPRRRRGPMAAAVAGGLLGTVLLGGAGAALVAPALADPVPPPALATTAAPAEPTPGAAVAAADLYVSGTGRGTVALRWRDTNAGAEDYLVVIEPAPRGRPATEPAETTTAHTVRGLRPETGYCFRIATGDGAVAQVTAPVCARTR